MAQGKPHYFKVKKAAAFLGVSLATLRAWDKQKKLKAHRDKKNGYRFYKISELEEALKMGMKRKYLRTKFV